MNSCIQTGKFESRASCLLRNDETFMACNENILSKQTFQTLINHSSSAGKMARIPCSLRLNDSEGLPICLSCLSVFLDLLNIRIRGIGDQP